MSYHSRRILTPGASKKRKEREAFNPLKPISSSAAYSAQLGTNRKPAASITKAEESVASNKLLAGYMAYEYLTKGTLFGQKFDPGKAEAVPLGGSSGGGGSSSGVSKRGKPMEMQTRWKKLENNNDNNNNKSSYAEVANILKTEGAHLQGIVNPTQLARWIQM